MILILGYENALINIYFYLILPIKNIVIFDFMLMQFYTEFSDCYQGIFVRFWEIHILTTRFIFGLKSIS